MGRDHYYQKKKNNKKKNPPPTPTLTLFSSRWTVKGWLVMRLLGQLELEHNVEARVIWVEWGRVG